jgi:hypothetical protein
LATLFCTSKGGDLCNDAVAAALTVKGDGTVIDGGEHAANAVRSTNGQSHSGKGGGQRAPLLSARYGNDGVENAAMAVTAREEEEDYPTTMKRMTTMEEEVRGALEVPAADFLTETLSPPGQYDYVDNDVDAKITKVHPLCMPTEEEGLANHRSGLGVGVPAEGDADGDVVNGEGAIAA